MFEGTMKGDTLRQSYFGIKMVQEYENSLAITQNWNIHTNPLSNNPVRYLFKGMKTHIHKIFMGTL